MKQICFLSFFDKIHRLLLLSKQWCFVISPLLMANMWKNV